MKNREVESGFHDPEDQNPRKDYMLWQQSDVSAVAEGRNVFSSSWIDQRLARIDRSIPITFAGNLDWSDETGDEYPRYNYTFWAEPHPAYSAEYPYNKVEQSESGHIREVDDTPGHERINEQHKKGTYREIDENGSSIQKVVGDSYEIVCGNDFVYIKGRTSVTVDGSHHLLVLGNVYREVLGDEDVLIRGNQTTRVSGDVHEEIGGNYYQSVKGNQRERIEGNERKEVSKNTYTWNGESAENIVGKDFIESVGGKFNFLSVDNMIMQTEADGEYSSSGNMSVLADGDGAFTAAGDVSVQADGDLSMGAGGSSDYQASSTISIAASFTSINDSGGSPAGAESISPILTFDSEFQKTEKDNPYPSLSKSDQFVRRMPPKSNSKGTPNPRNKWTTGLKDFLNRLFNRS